MANYKGSKRGFTEKYLIFNGNRSLSIDDPTIIQNKSTGRITGRFKLEIGDLTNSDYQLFSTSKLSGGFNHSWLAIDNNSARTIKIQISDGGAAQLVFYVNSLANDYFVDGLYHTFECIIDGIDNRFIIDGTTYNGTNLTFTTGNATSTFFTSALLDVMSVGVYNRWEGTTQLIDRHFRGNISDLVIYAPDLTTVLYSVNINGEIITPSSPTSFIKNRILDLQYNNSNIDISDTPKPIAANGAQVYGYGKFGSKEPLMARNFTGTQYDSFVNDSNAAQFTVSGHIKKNSNSTLNYLFGAERMTLPTTLGDLVVVTNSTSLYVIWGTDASFRYGGYIPNVINDAYIHIAVLFDKLNDMVTVYLDTKIVKLQPSSYVFDFTKITPLIIGDTYDIGGNVNDNRLTDCNIYKIKVSNYLMSASEIKADAKKYPKI